MLSKANRSVARLWLLGALSAVASAQSYRFTTLAGLAPAGDQDGIAAQARFSYPAGLTVDGEGNVYVADLDNKTVRKITPAGEVTTLAGAARESGYADGVRSGARFSHAAGVAVNASGTVYVADDFNQSVRAISPEGVVTTLAGTDGRFSHTDGVGPEASFYGPARLATDLAGNVYVNDSGRMLRKVTPAGVVTTIAGRYLGAGNVDGTASGATFNGMEGITVDREGIIYVFCIGAIRRVTSDGVVTTLAGSVDATGTADGTGRAARFGNRGDLAADRDGNIFVADTINHTIRKVTPAGIVTTIAGLAGISGEEDGVGPAARFRVPHGIAVDGAGAVYVSDSNNNTIRKISPAGAVSTFAGAAIRFDRVDGIGANARFNYPSGVALDQEGNAFVVDAGSRTIRKVTRSGEVTTVAGDPTATLADLTIVDGTGSAARFRAPGGIAFDGRNAFFVTDWGTVRKVTPAGVVTTIAGATDLGSEDGQGLSARFSLPLGLAADRDGNIYVADSFNHTIRRISPEATVTTLAGFAGQAGDANGTGSAARFTRPWGIAVDREGNLLITEGNSRLRKLTPGGVVTTLAGQLAWAPTTDGPIAIARFAVPGAIAADRDGNVFVIDRDSVRKISLQGYVTTVAGAVYISGSRDGTGAAARFRSPTGIAIDADGSLVIADGVNSVIRRGTPAVPLLPVSPQSQHIASGGSASLTVVAEGSNLSYQWLKDGGMIPGQTNARLDVRSATSADMGLYSVVVQSGPEKVESAVAVLSVATGVPGQLKNLAVRSVSGASAESLIAGFSLEGSGMKPMLLRGVGPGLSAFGVNDVLPDPILSAMNSTGAVIGQNNNWGGAETLRLAGQMVGAFPLSANSLDAALLPTLGAGSYTAQLSGESGIALLEVYDAGVGTSLNLVNLSARSRSGFGADVLTAGFVISGEGPRTVLLRGIGPALASFPFRVAGAMVDPRVRIFRGDTLVAANDDWAVDFEPANAFNRRFVEAGAFPLSIGGSKDAALVVTLPPGAYTAQVDRASGASGVALIEIYALRNSP